MPITTDEEIRMRAYQIWEERGRPEGQEAEHWRQAEDEVTMTRGDARAAAADADLYRNPGIGSSIGRQGDEPGGLSGDNTFPGDVMNDVEPDGGINPTQRGRTNK